MSHYARLDSREGFCNPHTVNALTLSWRKASLSRDATWNEKLLFSAENQLIHGDCVNS